MNAKHTYPQHPPETERTQKKGELLRSIGWKLFNDYDGENDDDYDDGENDDDYDDGENDNDYDDDDM